MKNKTKITAKQGVQELFIKREFEAPRELVFKAFVEPDLIVKWLGPREFTTEIDHMDNRSGGSYRFLSCPATGERYGFNGVMHEVTVPERLIRTFEYEGMPERGHVSLETATFEALAGGRTKLTIQCIFKSVADRDGMVASGMEHGVTDSHERLDALLENIIKEPAL